MHQREIALYNLALGKLPGEIIENIAPAAEKDNAAGLFVQPVDRVQAILDIISNGLGGIRVGLNKLV